MDSNKRRIFTYAAWAVLALLTLLRLALPQGLPLQFVAGTQYDDVMQIQKAMSIANGEWLGTYGPATLIKGVGYPLITACFHLLHIPYIFGWQALYVVACCLSIWAVSPVVQNKVLLAAGYLFLLFNPISFAMSLTRLYRDIGYYSLAFMCVSATLGFLLRSPREKAPWPWALAAGLFLALAANTREDSHWLYIYVAACAVAYCIFRVVVFKKEWKKYLALPLALLIGWGSFVLPVCSVNYACYGTFVLDEYNSGAYARAFGALSRVNNEENSPHLVIPEEQRMLLYELSPAFAELKEVLDGEDTPFAAWKEVHGEYMAGYFSFALRDAAAMIGKYKDAATANAYFNQLADEVNAACDAGLISAGPRRSGMVPRFYPWMLGPLLQSTGGRILDVVCCADITPLPSPANEDDAYLRVFEDFTGSTIAANRYMPDGQIVENYHYSGFRLWMQRGMRVLVILYSWLLPVLSVLALAAFVAVFIRALRKKEAKMRFWMLWVASGSLLCAFVLRCFMVAYAFVTFSTGVSAAYSAAGYPLLLAFIFSVFALFFATLPQKVKAAGEA